MNNMDRLQVVLNPTTRKAYDFLKAFYLKELGLTTDSEILRLLIIEMAKKHGYTVQK